MQSQSQEQIKIQTQNKTQQGTVCSVCNASNRQIAKFCKQCGSPIAKKDSSSPVDVIDLNSIIGQQHIKDEILSLINRVKIHNERKSRGLPVPELYLHYVFKGNTGTGKTMIAGYMAQEFKKIGALTKGTLLEIDFETLSSNSQNLSASVKKWIEKARGGVLLFDEIHKSINSLPLIIRSIADCGDDIIIIISGMHSGIDEYFDKNIDDKQRIGQFFSFSDYTAEELLQISKLKLAYYKYEFSEDVCEKLRDYIQTTVHSGNCEYKNAWLVIRDIIPKIENLHSDRLSKMSSYTDSEFLKIIPEDIPGDASARKTPEEVISSLENLIGMDDLKKEVKKLAQSVLIQKERQKAGSGNAAFGVHIVFTGNPGTGKTTVARILGELFKSIGILPSGHIVETDRSKLVAQYVGQTAPNVNKYCDQAMGGILFIDEAYTLAGEDGMKDTFGQEAIDTLLKRMEDDRGKFMVIAAGYKDEMNRFITSNPGLKSRFTNYFHLVDYKPDELYQIFTIFVKINNYELSDDAHDKAKKALSDIYARRDRTFANGRTVRTLFESAIKEQAGRLANLTVQERTDQLNILTSEDIPYDETAIKTPEQVIASMDNLIGMKDLKQEIKKLAQAVRIQKERQDSGIKGASSGVHIVFTGNPGTGKTTVARILGDLFKAIGLLPSGHVVETDRSKLVAQYVGATAPNVNRVCDDAMGGILFIDEAYTLAGEDGVKDTFGQEAIDTVMKRMEDDRGRFMVIAAGYKDEMNRFIGSNPGLKSRFTNYFHLEDYTPEELFQIFNIMTNNSGFVISPEASEKAMKALSEIYARRDRTFANGRTVRTLFESAIKEQASRLASSDEERTPDKLKLILPEDIPFEISKPVPVEEILSTLDSLIGMNNIKNEVRELVSFMNVQKQRGEVAGQRVSLAPHIVLTGNPGTGKTTVARILGRMFKSIGILPSDHVIEVDKAGLVSQYVGGTPKKVKEVVDRAMGGVLFIDEAYTLTPSGGTDSFSQEAIDTLMKSMEDNKGKFIVMAAGYKKDMERFLQSNAGLQSRFTRYFHFEDYTPSELQNIFLQMIKEKGYKITEKGMQALSQICTIMYANRGENFGNGRDVRNLFEKVLQNQSVRLSKLISSGETPDKDTLSLLKGDDFPAAEKPSGSLEDSLAKLNNLTGLSSVKTEIQQLINYLKAEKARNRDSQTAQPLTLHYIFTGNPGTGKTTVARILADIFKNMGILSKGHLVERDRSGLVGQYVGDTEKRTADVISEAMGGVLFIDEAYALAPPDSGNDFGRKAIDVLLKRMEDDKGKFIVIAAGYKNEMRQFLDSNPGLPSRFTRTINFDDYNPDEMYLIFEGISQSRKMIMTPQFSHKLKNRLTQIYSSRDKNFANGRTVRNLFESTLQIQSNRISQMNPDTITENDMFAFSEEDLV